MWHGVDPELRQHSVGQETAAVQEETRLRISDSVKITAQMMLWTKYDPIMFSA